ncbi:MAG: hypothetical protein BWK80_35845 [Desulfobacteraceae bacterium IS3]|nr:MAG: hypothetical protein BWK80_35845 [Desulfobacteraceae bacterium IS3]HAO21398.1 hypothetical protein [Desulfobacteraceae bacterium]
MMIRLKDKYPDLTPERQYAVIGIEADYLRILNDKGCPYLYPAELFDMTDPYEPEDWVTEFGDQGEKYAYPAPLNTCGFFEDFFDGKKNIVATFWQIINQKLAGSMLKAS